MDGQELHILLVDDDEDDYIITRDLLAEIKGEQFNLKWIDTYDAALAAMEHNQHDVYLIDYRLGEHNGIELLSEAIERGCTAPLILLTGQGDRAIDVEAMKKGAADYLVKGQIDAPSLERSIRYAIERKQAKEAMQRLAEQRKRLIEVSQSILSTLTLDEIIKHIEQAFQDILQYDICGLYWLDEETSLLRPSQIVGKDGISEKFNVKTIPYGKGIISTVIQSEKGELVNNAHLDPRSVYPEGIKVECEHLISIPIRTTEKTLGAFSMARNSDLPFTNEEFELVQLFMTQAANAIENARLHAETEKRAQQLAVLHELDRAITTSLRVTDIYHAFTHHAIRLLPYDRTSITLLEGDQMRVTYVAGKDETIPSVGTTLLRKSLTPGRVVTQGQPLLHNIAAGDHLVEDEQLWSKEIQSSMIIPLRVKGQVIGTWNIGSRQTGVYNPDDLDIAQSMADQLAIAIENGRLFQQAKQEITERMRVEEALRESEVKYRTLIERMSEGLLQVDNNDVIQFVNDRFCEIVGFSRDELLGKAASELLLNEQEQTLIEGENHAHPQETADKHETRLKKKSGETTWVQIGRAPVVDAEGQVIGSVRIHTDITERKRAEETRARLEDQLRQSQKMEAVGTLAGGIAHDFNNLLTAIMGYAGLALDTLSPDETPYTDILGIQKTAERAADLTRQLLAFARRQMIKLKVLNLNDLILNMSKMLHRLIGEDIELVTLPAPDLGRVRIDPGQFEQVLVNLAVNARDAMPNGGKLTIETANVTLDRNYTQQHAEVIPGEYVMLAVSDNGTGMSEEVQSHIFEPFFTTKEIDRGTGLGLATCFGIVKQSNGHIWVYSEPGIGTTFKVYLPRIIEAETPSPFRRDDFIDLPRGDETVLLVEDEASVRDLAARFLRQQGYNLLEAANGDEALRLAQKRAEQKIHIVVTDVVMPQMGGKALTEQLKTTRPDIKVLFTSGYADNAIVHHGVLEPDIAFLQKPFSPEMLVRKVREVLDEEDSIPKNSA